MFGLQTQEAIARQAAANAIKTARASSEDDEDDGGTPLHAMAEGAMEHHRKERERRQRQRNAASKADASSAIPTHDRPAGVLAETIAETAPASEFATLATVQPNPYTSYTAPATVTVEMRDYRASGQSPAAPASMTPVQPADHIAPDTAV